MKAVLFAFGIALIFSLFVTPVFIRWLIARQYGQFIRQDGPTSHATKRGTPTMGGVVIIGATFLGYFVANLLARRMPDFSGLLLIFLMGGLGIVGFLDDYIKITNQRSEGLKPRAKVIGQGLVGIIFALGALIYKGQHSLTPASSAISLVRDTKLDFLIFGSVGALIIFVIWANFLITAWSNAVNLTDGLDGLATGASMISFGAYVLIAIWQLNQACHIHPSSISACYAVRDPRDLAIFAAAVVGACFGFLWWNTSPAQIFMGDTGSLALGGAFAGLSILTRTEVIAILIGGLFVLVVLSDVIQISCFKLTGKRVFRMAPLHHHFELLGWKEVTIVIRFWMLAMLGGVLGLGIFYAEWLAKL